MLLAPVCSALPATIWRYLGSRPKHPTTVPSIFGIFHWHYSALRLDSRIFTSLGGREADCRYDLASLEERLD